jgi:esterase/lipase
MAAVQMAHPMARNRWRAWVERVLPYYSPRAERLRNARSEMIARHTATTTDWIKRVIDQYGRADAIVQAPRNRRHDDP